MRKLRTETNIDLDSYSKEYRQEYYLQNKEYYQNKLLDWKIRNQEARLYHSCKSNAKRKALEFTIELKDIVIPETCPYLSIPITNIFGQGKVDSNASIDRIDSTKGYIPGNIQVISDLANRMKQNATPEQLVAFAKGVLRIHDRE